jgi:hypothetical protein
VGEFPAADERKPAQARVKHVVEAADAGKAEEGPDGRATGQRNHDMNRRSEWPIEHRKMGSLLAFVVEYSELERMNSRILILRCRRYRKSWGKKFMGT